MAAHTPLHPDAALGLALALVASSTAPLVLLDGDLTVIAVSRSFCQAFGIDLASAPGRSIFELGAGEWDVRQLRSLLKATADGHAAIDAYEMDLKRPGRETRRLIIGAYKLEYADMDGVRLVLSVSDVTEARLSEKHKDDLLREKAILLQELQHRVANSLQIIASVLLQSAKRVPSEEVRSHLHDAHNRVMSVAAVQQQLAATRLGEVGVRAYFIDLCRSISASMIPDPEQLSLDVHVDDSVASSNISVSLGLIVTELVINALKHGFPGRRHGKITVGYNSDGPDWTLSVSDNGFGMPTDPGSAKSGLGTGIIEALARQLCAEVQVAGANPGTRVSIVHVNADE
ncbi:MAG TPA: histidine kinase dimerization/phosphoacceptor domain -containing protein, partial [Caulobacteraceae bacterium]